MLLYAVLSHSVVSYSLRLHGLQPTRHLCPWGFSRQEYWSALPSSRGGLGQDAIILSLSFPICKMGEMIQTIQGLETIYIKCQSFSHVRFFVTPWTVACQAPLSVRFPRQEYQNGLPFPSQGDFPDPGLEPMSPVSPALACRFFTH